MATIMGDDIVSTTQTAIGIITGFLGLFALFVGVLGFMNYRLSSSVKKELQAQINKQGKDFQLLKEEIQAQIEKQGKEFQTLKEGTFREFAINYLNIAARYLLVSEVNYFHSLGDYCRIYWFNKFDMNDVDLLNLNFFGKLIDTYEVKKDADELLSWSIRNFLDSFLMFRFFYSKVEKVKEIAEKVNLKFGENAISESVRRVSETLSKSQSN